jgi:hypothetical protein
MCNNQWRTQGAFRVFKSPQNSEGTPKNCAKLNPIVKTVKKMLNLGSQHTKIFGKKSSKILHRFAIVLL